MGYVIEPENGIRIYHFGDTALFDLTLIGRLYSPLVGILGCTQPWEVDDPGAGEILTGEMTPVEAALAAEMLGVRLAIASHYLTLNEDTASFVDEVRRADSTGLRQAIAPSVDDTVRVNTDGSFSLIHSGAANLIAEA
jgi:L-ascorbate metabolism protein UlaG (beta-lactamase superfamily)